jgi:ribosomal protein S18 acetylase RimI-like enzyme
MLELITNPSEKHLSEIKEWMEEEFKSPINEGLYVNWPIIEKAFNNNEMIISIFEEKIVGFIVFHLNSPKLSIHFLEIKPNQRRKGFGKKIVFKVIDSFRMEDVTIVEVECINENSRKFCRKTGFVENLDPYRIIHRSYLLEV